MKLCKYKKEIIYFYNLQVKQISDFYFLTFQCVQVQNLFLYSKCYFVLRLSECDKLSRKFNSYSKRVKSSQIFI